MYYKYDSMSLQIIVNASIEIEKRNESSREKGWILELVIHELLLMTYIKYNTEYEYILWKNSISKMIASKSVDQ